MGYQISQYELPFCRDGWIEVEVKRIGITRAHLEEDTGKLVHTVEGVAGARLSEGRGAVPLVDLNRTGDRLPGILGRITYPANGATIKGVTNFIGTANLPD